MSEATLLPGFRPHFAEIDGVRTRYFLGGEGPPLTIVHGLGGAAVNFTKLAPILARRRRVLIPDLPGHGLSEPLEHVEGIATYSRHVHKVAELEGMLPGALLGYSMNVEQAFVFLAAILYFVVKLVPDEEQMRAS